MQIFTKKQLLLILFIVVFFLIPLPQWILQAQNSASSPGFKDQLVLKVKECARKDVQMNKAPETTEGLSLLFGKEAEKCGLTLLEIQAIYETTYKKATESQNPLKKLFRIDFLGWLAFILLGLITILNKFIVGTLVKLCKLFGKAVYNQIAGLRPFWRLSLNRYRKSLEAYYGTVRIPFLKEQNLSMKEVYVSLRMKDEININKALTENKHILVTGEPGSGKSMLLRNLTYSYSCSGLKNITGHPIPVLIELNRLNDSDFSLKKHMVHALECNNFPQAGNFIESFLEKGRLLLLFDGLDEVNTSNRQKVVRNIKDLVQTYPANCVIVTCRKAVYKNDFADSWDTHLEIVNFDDKQIEQYLTPWENKMPEERSVEHLLSSLYERPRIMALARNPLLLTMVANLYTNTAFQLPHSRAEFYSQSSKLMLESWKNERNIYKAVQKHFILKHLALFNQVRSLKEKNDRKSIPYEDLMEQIGNILPKLHLNNDDILPILSEIIERSGLLKEIDGGDKYQFSHLTLQEFFAAQELESEQDTLLSYFKETPGDWREVIRLWCGLEHESTELINKLFTIDSQLALECLGDTQKVASECVKKITDFHKEHITNAAKNDSFAKSFALAAADPRPRGKELLDYLEESLADPLLCQSAAAVLMNTNLPRAAEILTSQAVLNQDLRPCLIQLGNLTVAALENKSFLCEPWAIDVLYKIGTPKAALQLASILWYNHTSAPYHAAWRLAALLPQHNIEEALSTVKLTWEQKKSRELIDWVWTPFTDQKESSIQIITGRIAYLLDKTPDEIVLPEAEYPFIYDPRLVIPLCTITAQTNRLVFPKKEEREVLLKTIEKIENESLPEKINSGVEKQLPIFEWENVKESISNIFIHSSLIILFRSLASDVQLKLLKCLCEKNPIPHRDDWCNLLRPSRFSFKKSIQFNLFRCIIILLYFINIYSLGMEIYSNSSLLNWANLRPGLIILLYIILSLNMLFIKEVPKLESSIVFFLILFVFGFCPVIAFFTGISLNTWIIGTIIGSIGGVVLYLFIYIIMQKNLQFDMGFYGFLIGLILNNGLSVVSGFLGSLVNKDIGSVIGYTVYCCIILIPAILYLAFVNHNPVIKNIFGFIAVTFFISTIANVFSLIIMYQPTKIAYTIGKWPFVSLFWIMVIVSLIILTLSVQFLERRALNPLHGLLFDKEESPRDNLSSKVEFLVHSFMRKGE